MKQQTSNLGQLAYYDTVRSGLVPCKVTGYDYEIDTVYFTVTASRGAYKAGEKLSSVSSYVIPRKMIFTRNGQYHIRTFYAWVNGVTGVYAIRTRGAY